MVQILAKILADLSERKDFSALRLTDFHVCSPFTVVLLSDGSVGSAGNYSVQNHAADYAPARAKENYASFLPSDPLLLHTLQSDRTLAGRSLFTAILSALSQDLLSESVLSACGLKIVPAQNWQSDVERLMRPGDRVKMIGHGGALPLFCTSGSVGELQICDYTFRDAKYRDLARREIEGFGFDPLRLRLCSYVSELDSAGSFDICFITGSALCNGTMEDLLERSQGCREVIVQGPSCSVFPVEFFRRSATLLLTTRKTHAEFDVGGRASDEIYAYVDQNYVAISRVGL